MPTFTALVAAQADDAQEVAGTATIADTTISVDATTDWGGARFLGVTIPKGSTIASAVLTVEPTATTEDEPLHLFYCQAADNAGTFTTGASDLSNRTRTNNSVLWDSADLGADGTLRFNTPNLATIVGEVISRPGWVSGNALVFLWQGNADTARDLTIKSFDTSAADGPELTVVYQLPGATGGGGGAAVPAAEANAGLAEANALLGARRNTRTIRRRRGIFR